MEGISGAIESIPGYDIVMEAWNEFAGEKLQTKDPYFEELPDGTTRRRKAPEGTSPSDAIVFKKIVNSAWRHDRCMCGCFWADWGLGQAPLICLIPIFGPLIMYSLHLRINSMAEELHIPTKLHAKMTANVTFDFLITLVPILGAVLSYINACSTRNAALVHTFLLKRALENQTRFGDNRPLYAEYSRNAPNADRFQAVSTPAPQPPPNPYPHISPPTTHSGRSQYQPQPHPSQKVSRYQPVSYDGKVKNKGKSGPMEMGIR